MKLRKSFLLFLTAILLFTLLLPLAVTVSLVLLFVKDSRKKTGLSGLFYAIAWAIDLLGNVVCADLFNVCLIRHGGYLFGEVGETISSVLGKNQMAGTLSKTGWMLVKLLDRIDEDHCLKAAGYYHKTAA